MSRDLSRPLREAWIVSAVRTPVGRYGGALAAVRPDDMAATVLRAVVERAPLDPALVEDVILGCANQAGEDNRNVARMALLLAGYPVEIPGATVNRLCGSGMEAVIQAARTVQTGAASLQDVNSCLLKALEAARRYATLSLELRAAVSLARLWRDQGKHLEARGLVTEVYGRFTEGLSTPDLSEAHAFLEEMGAAQRGTVA